MSINQWFNFLGGIITVRIRGPYPEKIINLALSRGILLSDVKRDGQDLSFTTRKSGYPALENIAERFGYEIEVVKRSGMPFYKRVFRRRWMLLLGALVFVAALYILSSFVWFLNIKGAKAVAPEAVARSAARYGLHCWAFKGGLDKNRIEEEILREIPQLSYVEVDIKGVRATIKVVEKVLPGERFLGPCHLVAKRGGVVEEVMVVDGSPMVAKGDTVGVGNILISGTIIPGEEYPEGTAPPPRLVRAQGVVKARVWYEGYGEHPLLEEKAVLTGKKSTGTMLTTPWGKWVIHRPDASFSSFQVDRANHKLDTPWGEVSLSRESRRETRISTREFEEREALEAARKEARANLQSQLKEAEKILSITTKTVSSPSDTIVRVKAEAEVLEDICRPQPLNVEQELPGEDPERAGS